MKLMGDDAGFFGVAPPETRAVDPLELYAAGIDTSDYVGRVAPRLRAAVPQIGDLLDIGAGGGQLGRAVRDPQATWTAIEPAAGMQRRLHSLIPPPYVLPLGWQQADLPPGCADTVLAANIAAPSRRPKPFSVSAASGHAAASSGWFRPSTVRAASASRAAFLALGTERTRRRASIWFVAA
ncbi:hypothetical protein ACFQWF_04470 [Methylorubrum suomiense]